jgi:sporulation protein YlmC with PRC-barrel domain
MSIDAAHVLAVLAGVVFGSGAISTACWVWLQKQIFAFGGSALCGSGVVLLGLSIWHSVEFGVGGVSLKLQTAVIQKLQAIDSRIAFMQQDFTHPGGGQRSGIQTAGLASFNYITGNHQVPLGMILGASVSDDEGKVIGRIDDVLMTDKEHKAVTAVLSLVRDDKLVGKRVAVPFDQLKIEAYAIVLPGSTEETLQSAPEYGLHGEVTVSH